MESAPQNNTRNSMSSRVKPTKPFRSWKFGIGAAVVAGAIVYAGIYYHQSTQFNSQVTINGTNVGGLTADEAIKKLKSTVLKNEVYVGKEKILDGEDTKLGFTTKDVPAVEKLLKKQMTLFPSSGQKNYTLVPSEENQYRSQTLKDQVRHKLIEWNKTLKAPVDAQAHLKEGKIVVSKSKNGTQYDVDKLLQAYKGQEYNSNIHLKPVYLEPVRENSEVVKKEKQTLQELVHRTVHYTVQKKEYALKGSELIKNASITKTGQITIDPTEIKSKIAKINESQSTLDKTFQFRTHSGSVIPVKGQSYGWAINVEKESNLLKSAFEKGETSVNAKYIYGKGWSTYGIGYHNTTNNGIGDTYAEVSIQEQRIWLYKDGKMVLTTNVVTGRHDTGEDTSTGVWYVEYKETPSVLQGSEVGNPNYSVKVKYWAPFTLGGQGFHDAPWRSAWGSTAYLHHGSGGCVNTPSSIMKSVYNTLIKDEPVIVY